MLVDVVEMSTKLGRSALCHLTRYRRELRRGLRMARGNRAGDSGPIVGSIADKGGKSSRNLVEQGRYLWAITNFPGRQPRG
jgi:hypothetical protein